MVSITAPGHGACHSGSGGGTITFTTLTLITGVFLIVTIIFFNTVDNGFAT